MTETKVRQEPIHGDLIQVLIFITSIFVFTLMGTISLSWKLLSRWVGPFIWRLCTGLAAGIVALK